MFLRKLGKRGAEMVEYAIVLACIAAVGVGFYSSNDSKLTGVLDSLFGNVAQVIGLADSGKHPLKGTGVSNDKLTALDMQTSIPYDFISQELAKLFGEGTHLQAISLDIDGKLDNVWYSKDGTLYALDSDTVKKLEGTYPSSGLQKAYEDNWKKNAKVDADSKKYYALITNGYKPADFNGMYVAYDSYGNVIQNVNTSNLSGDVVSQIADKSTTVYIRKVNTKDVTGFTFDNTNGFQEIK